MKLQEKFRQWLFRFGRDEHSPVVLTQRRIFILPTRAGLLYAVVLCVMLLAAINYNLGLGHALVFLLAGLGLAAMVHTFRNLLGLRLTHGRVESVFAGETALFPVHVEAPKTPARRALELNFAGNNGAILDIPPGEQVSAAIPCATRSRGRFDPGPITLSSRYPLGLFRAWSYPHLPLSCTVYPKPLETPLPHSSATVRATGQQGYSGQEDFSGLRERQPGDPLRHVDWKAEARNSGSGPLLIKEFSGGSANELLLDWAQTDPQLATEERLSILCGWVLQASQAQQRFALHLPGCALPAGSDESHRLRCLEALALFPA